MLSEDDVNRRSGSITYIDGMYGLGDNIYQRPFVRELSSRGVVWLKTPWPQLYMDFQRVGFVQAYSALRTQQKNLELIEGKIPYVLRSVAEGSASLRYQLTYTGDTLKIWSTTQTFRRITGLHGKLIFDLPSFKTRHLGDRPYIVIRPVTLRSEWLNTARNPDPSYIAQAAKHLSKNYTIISVADIFPGAEDLIGEMPYYDVAYHKGELSVMDLLGLVQNAAGCVGGVGWIVPAALAYGTPLLCILGGLGEHNAPEKITDPDQDLSKLIWAKPDNFCYCGGLTHDCPKFISTFSERLGEFEQLLSRIAEDKPYMAATSRYRLPSDNDPK